MKYRNGHKWNIKGNVKRLFTGKEKKLDNCGDSKQTSHDIIANFPHTILNSIQVSSHNSWEFGQAPSEAIIIQSEPGLR
jgi:hypothetical protein